MKLAPSALAHQETHSLEKHKLESSVLVLLVSTKRFGVAKTRVCLRIERMTEARIRTSKHSFLKAVLLIIKPR